MGSRVRIRSIENFFSNIDFEYVFLDLTKNSKSGFHMVGTASLASIWSAPLTDSPRTAPYPASGHGECRPPGWSSMVEK